MWRGWRERLSRFWQELLRSWRRGAARERDLAEEIEAHFRLAVEDRVRRGESPEQAMAAARREFGSEAHVREVTRSQWRGARLSGVLREFAIALRTLRRNPRFTVVAALCIGIGVGVTMTMFTALHAILLRPLPYPNAAELVSINAEQEVRAQHMRALVSRGWLDLWRAAEATGELGTWRTESVDLTGPEDIPERAESAAVTANLFPLLGVPPLLGRGFHAEEEQSGADDVVLLGYELWQHRFGGDTGLLGRSIDVDGRPHRVVGVMPPDFSFPEGTTLWKPLVTPPLPPDILFYDAALATLSPGATLVDLRAQLDAAMSDRPADGWSFTATPLHEQLTGVLRRPVLIFQGAALLVLLLACANVATLLLARSAARRHEMAVRAALGASGGRLMRHVLTEATALACMGGVIAVFVVLAGVRVLARAFPEGVPSYIELTPQLPVLLLGLATTLLTALLFGLGPALRARRVRGDAAVTGAARGGAGTHDRGRASGTLVAAEVAISVVLLAGAALLVRTYVALEDSLGFEHHGVLAVGVDLPPRSYRTAERRIAFHEELGQRLQALHGVEEVSGSSTTPPLAEGVMGGTWPFRDEAGATTSLAEEEGRVVALHYVAPGFISVLGVPLLQGRDIAAADRRDGEETAVVNALFANRYYPGGDAVGRRILTEHAPGQWRDPVRIVGVVADFRHAPPPFELMPTMYMHQWAAPSRQTYLLRTSLANPAALAPVIRQIVREIDPSLAVQRIEPQTAAVKRTFWRQRLQRNVIAGFAGLALLLALFGVYGVLSYAVAQRTSELGVRLALGASAQQLLLGILAEAARMAAVGVAIGLVVALALGRVLHGLLYGVEPGDPVVLTAVAATLFVVALCAAALPAWRASRLDPQVAMRGSP
jgi:putative ABC transport system permease protein